MRVLTQQGRLLIKTNLRGGGRLSDRGRLLEGGRQNESLRYLFIAASKLLRSNQPDYVFQSNSWRRVWVQGPLRRNIFQTIIAKTSINIYPFMLTITTFTKVSNWRESNLLKGNTSKYRYSKQLQRDNDDLLLNVVN